jgi:AbrB family looped-hinge helix DNA binding protein
MVIRMIDIAITRLSSKGQIVIPLEMRNNFNEGEKLVIIKNEEQLILKKASDFNKKFEEDLIFAKRTEDALKKYEKGLYKEMNDKSFTNEIEKW